MNGRVLAAALVASSVAACGAEKSDPFFESVTLPIVAGQPDTGHPNVVAVGPRRARCSDTAVVTCTGTLIAPRVVLTAAHCLELARTPGSLEVFFGDDVRGAGQFVVVETQRAHPSYDSTTNEYDLGLLRLAETAPVSPHPLPTLDVATLSGGASLRAVGFGETSRGANDAGVKRAGTMSLAAVRTGSFDADPSPSMTCAGDSGGPVFALINTEEQLVGITSRGDWLCETTAFSVRVDVALADFVQPFLDEADLAPPIVVPASEGDFPCANDGDCPAVLACEEDGSQCILPALGSGAFSDGCTNDAMCAPGSTCARLWPTQCRCFTPRVPISPDPPHAGEIDNGAGCQLSHRPRSTPWIIVLAAGGMLCRRRRRAPRERLPRERAAAAEPRSVRRPTYRPSAEWRPPPSTMAARGAVGGLDVSRARS